MRDRLIELINYSIDIKKTCPKWNTCEPCEGCKYDFGAECDFNGRVADHLLANGVILPPCKVGDTVYICTCFGFWYTKPEINKCEMQIKSIRVTESRMIFEAEHGKDNVDYFELKDIGKTVFLTREEAEAALAERGGKNNV